MANPAEQVRQIVEKFLERCLILERQDSDLKERLAKVETKLYVIMWFLGLVGTGTVMSIIAWLSKGGK